MEEQHGLESRVGARPEFRLGVKSRIVEVVRRVRRCGCTMGRIVIMERKVEGKEITCKLTG